MGEKRSKIFTCGSPDIDVMLSKNLPSIENAKKRYNINFNKYLLLNTDKLPFIKLYYQD